jgi:hypothetical protein
MSLKPRKRRKKDAPDEPIEQDGLIFQLPQETLLLIFKYLSIEDLILVSGYILHTSSSSTFNLFFIVPAHYFVVLHTINNYGKASIYPKDLILIEY